jgi:hypothetical protein
MAQTNPAKDGDRRLLDVFLQMQHYGKWKHIVEQAARMQQPPGAGGGNPAAADRQARLSGRQEQMQEFAGIGSATGGRGFDPAPCSLRL